MMEGNVEMPLPLPSLTLHILITCHTHLKVWEAQHVPLMYIPAGMPMGKEKLGIYNVYVTYVI